MATKSTSKKIASKKKPAAKQHGTKAFHARSGDIHVVGVSALRVLILQDGENWFAQGLEIDYAASGTSKDDVKSKFEKGLCDTVSEHLLLHGTIEKFLKVAPQEAWSEYYKLGESAEFTTIQIFKRTLAAPDRHEPHFPFREIKFILPQSSAIAEGA